ncbi:DUF1772 domain-containing protein [Nonomuraea cavernae]|uniref:DUF1772 domain-containing protein n=1 Tax=Nonomuraea cavernae TaxID=2045107 RepID=UPI0033C1440F
MPATGLLAGALTVTSLLVTVFGNVPLHRYIRQWATTSVTDGYIEILQRWETFHAIRTMTALAAFVLIVIIAAAAGRGEPSPDAEGVLK